jgi:hypothetical protein
MLDEAWPLGLVVGAVAAPIAVLLPTVTIFARHSSRKRYQDRDVWASVRLAYVEQADGILPIGVVRVQNPDAGPVIVSVSTRWPRLQFGHWHRYCRARAPLSLRSPRVSRRPRPPEGALLGPVRGGGVAVWELPLARSHRGHPGQLPIVRVRVDQVGPRTKIFAWAMPSGPAFDARRTAEPRRPAWAE